MVAGAHAGADVDEAGHQDGAGGDEGGAADDGAGDHAEAGGAKARLVPAGGFEGHLVEDRGAGAWHGVAVVEAEGEQDGLLEPGVDGPAVLGGFGDAQVACVEGVQRFVDGGAVGALGLGVERGAAFPDLGDPGGEVWAGHGEEISGSF